MAHQEKNPKNAQKDQQPPTCSCVKDPYAELPPGLRPQNKTWKSNFRHVICPGCGLDYWTNITGDLCMDCKKNGIQIPASDQPK